VQGSAPRPFHLPAVREKKLKKHAVYNSIELSLHINPPGNYDVGSGHLNRQLKTFTKSGREGVTSSFHSSEYEVRNDYRRGLGWLVDLLTTYIQRCR
jgi:hypothetical protein